MGVLFAANQQNTKTASGLVAAAFSNDQDTFTQVRGYQSETSECLCIQHNIFYKRKEKHDSFICTKKRLTTDASLSSLHDHPRQKTKKNSFFTLLIYNTCNPRQVVVVVEGRKERGYPFIAGLVLLLRWYANPFLFWRRTFQAYIWERGTHTRERKRAAYIRNPSK